MANISAATNEKVFPIRQWLGLNENPDGDTKLRMGEASVMTNWHVTRDGNLKRRPGTELIAGLRIAYIPTASSLETAICETASSATMPCYDSVITDSLFRLARGNKVGDFTAEQAAAYSGNLYVGYRHKFYLVTGADTSGGISTWRGLRVTAEPSGGGTRPVTGLWSGRVNGRLCVLAACDGFLYSLWNADNGIWQRNNLGSYLPSGGTTSISTKVHIFPFDGKAYVLTGQRYMVYDGTTLEDVVGYRPLVAIAISPLVGGELGTAASGEVNESINLLNGQRRAWLSPDGEGNVFQLPESGLQSVDWVKDLKTDDTLPTNQYTVDLAAGTVAFSDVPAASVNAYEVAWTMATTYRSQVESMNFSELYSGTQDTRVFLYGDGSNQAIYSGLDYNGMPTAEYFPDQNAIRIGDSNTPITAMIRHNSSLICYKPDSTFAITFGITTLATDVYTPAFYSTPVNRSIGNLSVGQVRLVGNNPITTCGEHLYSWRGNQYGNLTNDEKQAKVISERVQASMKELQLSLAMMWDDNDGQEFYISQNGVTLVLNYATDTWARYEGLDITCMANFQNSLYCGTADGRVLRFDEELESDEGDAINARWESGAMSFGQDYSRKLAARLWVGLEPTDGSTVTVTVRTDRKETFTEKLVSASKAKVEGEPFMVRCKLKAKKFVFYRLIFLSNDYQPPATVTAADVQVRFVGYAK